MCIDNGIMGDLPVGFGAYFFFPVVQNIMSWLRGIRARTNLHRLICTVLVGTSGLVGMSDEVGLS
jgi:hypothetical protein